MPCGNLLLPFSRFRFSSRLGVFVVNCRWPFLAGGKTTPHFFWANPPEREMAMPKG